MAKFYRVHINYKRGTTTQGAGSEETFWVVADNEAAAMTGVISTPHLLSGTIGAVQVSQPSAKALLIHADAENSARPSGTWGLYDNDDNDRPTPTKPNYRERDLRGT